MARRSWSGPARGKPIPDANPLALVFTPGGRDAAVACALLKEAGIASTICPDLVTLERAIDESAWFVLIAEEAAAGVDLRGLAARIEAQPTWSDLPFIVLTRRGGGVERNPAAARLAEVLGNSTFLERPFHPTTFVSVARSAVRGRRRQFEARMRMDELVEGEKRLQTALLAGRLGSWELDLETGQFTATATCMALFGLGAGEPLSYKDVLSAVHPEDRARMQAAVRRSVERGIDYAIEYRTVWPDSSIHWAEIRARILRAEAGKASRLVGVSSDITERRTAEDRLRRLNESLEDRVAERTAQLERSHEIVLAEIAQRERAEDLLRQAQKMEMIGQLTGGIAHDFNNLLMAVLGNLELLRKRLPPDPRTVRMIDGALQGAQRGAALTQRLLAFARRQDLKAEPTDVAALIEGMTDLFERSAGSKVELAIAVADDLPPAMIDANQVELALLNLVVNARDAMPDGGTVSVAVDTVFAPAGGELDAGDYVRFTVADTGHGMSPETLAKATEPFFSTKELGKGTGLGLSMVHGLAIQLGGALRLFSTEGVGTIAELWLPATDQRVTRYAEADAPAPEGSSPARMRILVVDDDALVSANAVDMLEDLGHEALEAHSAERALEILADNRSFDLMITDFSMPKMTGVELARKAHEVRPELPILLATGYAEHLTGGDYDLPRLSKPYGQAQLKEEITKLMKAGSA